MEFGETAVEFGEPLPGEPFWFWIADEDVDDDVIGAGGGNCVEGCVVNDDDDDDVEAAADVWPLGTNFHAEDASAAACEAISAKNSWPHGSRPNAGKN